MYIRLYDRIFHLNFFTSGKLVRISKIFKISSSHCKVFILKSIVLDAFLNNRLYVPYLVLNSKLTKYRQVPNKSSPRFAFLLLPQHYQNPLYFCGGKISVKYQTRFFQRKVFRSRLFWVFANFKSSSALPVMALYIGFPVSFSQMIVVSLWFVMPIPLTWKKVW